MKKTVIILALIGFVTFSSLCIKNVVAYTTRVEMVNFDKDPKKGNDKKVTESKNNTTREIKADSTYTRIIASSSSDKSAASTECGDKDKAGCCSSSPGKK
jgi:hypothetical protein